MRSVIALFAFFLLLAMAQAAPTGTTTGTLQMTRGQKLTNAERIVRGLPIQQPKRLYDPSSSHLRPRQEPSGIPRR
ncbi:hypothetical protein IAT38_002058 [Cryptococcus sp. DSM 104549]